MRLYLSFLASLAFPLLASATFTEPEKLSDLHELKTIIAADYGPLRFKEEHLGINLERLTKTYEEKISATQSDDEFRYTLMQFIAEFRDSHFSGRVLSNEKTGLGFTTDLVQGKVVIEDIDRNLLPLGAFPFFRGDEIVQFDNEPVMNAVAKLQTYNGMGNDESAKKLAVYFLPHRQARVVPLAKGSATIGIRKRGSEGVSEITLPWQQNNLLLEKVETKGPIGIADWCSEKSRINPPPGSEMITDVPFTAFTFPTNKGKIGLLRIPHYYPVDKATGQEVAALRFAQYEKVVQKFEAETVGLIIDQDYNCGGSIIYVNKMLSLFLREPFTPAELEFRASLTQIDGLSRHLAKFSPATDGYQKFNDLIAEIKKSHEAGEYSTRKIPLWGVMEVKLELPGTSHIDPNPIGYSKPIVLLINELSGSGGDLFPAMMKGLGRARLFGRQTMGAGGHVWDDPHIELKNSKVTVNLTRSLIYRPNGRAIENAGVLPHAPYEITMEDFLDGYRGYLNAATGELLNSVR